MGQAMILLILFMRVFKMKINDKMIQNTLQGMVFFVIFVFIFIKVSYILRPEHFPVGSTTIKEYLSLPYNTIDVVYIGASRVNQFWAPMEAYKRHGLVSANCTASGLPQQFTKFVTQEALKSQSPKLLLISLDTFSTITNLHDVDSNIRYVTDSFRYSFERLQAIERGIPNKKSTLGYHLDIAKYHTNVENLLKKNCWRYAFIYNDTKVINGLDGYFFIESVSSIEYPYYHDISEMPLSDSVNSYYLDLIKYVNGLDMNIIFTISPHGRDESEQKRINYMRRIATESSIIFLSGNDFFDEIGLDSQIDFYNRSHTNIFGAVKYTEWLCRYLKNHYDLPDRRGDYRYADWDLAYETWGKRVVEVKTNIIKLMPEELRNKIQENM
jgi:hypothetical protein